MKTWNQFNESLLKTFLKLVSEEEFLKKNYAFNQDKFSNIEIRRIKNLLENNEILQCLYTLKPDYVSNCISFEYYINDDRIFISITKRQDEWFLIEIRPLLSTIGTREHYIADGFEEVLQFLKEFN